MMIIEDTGFHGLDDFDQDYSITFSCPSSYLQSLPIAD